METIIQILFISTIAGMGTLLGGFISIFCPKRGGFIGGSLGFASGVMLMMAFMGLLAGALEASTWQNALLGFIAGCFFLMALDLALPHIEIMGRKEKGIEKHRGYKRKNGMYRVGVLVAIGVLLHNFPEGLAVATSYTADAGFGLVVALAIGLHNIPEGIVSGLPLCCGGAKRSKVLLYTFLSGLAEPAGALFGALVFAVSAAHLSIGLAFAAGAMCYITADELIPLAHKYGRHNFSIGLVLGFILMFYLLQIA